MTGRTSVRISSEGSEVEKMGWEGDGEIGFELQEGEEEKDGILFEKR